MCLALPAEVLRLDGEFAEVRVLIGCNRVRVAVVDGLDVREGERVLVHAGFVIQTVDQNEAQSVLDTLLGQINDGSLELSDIGLG